MLKDRLYRIGMVVAIASTVLMGLSTDVTVWAISRFVAGLSSAAGMLLGTGLILNWLIRHNHRSELGIQFRRHRTRIAGCAAAGQLMRHFRLARTVVRLRRLRLPAAGAGPALLPAPDRSNLTTSGVKMEDKPPSKLFMRLFLAAYFCAGFGYVVSATFIVAIVDHLPGLARAARWSSSRSASPPRRPASTGFHRSHRRPERAGAAAVLQIVGIPLPLGGAGDGDCRRAALRRHLHRHGQPGAHAWPAVTPDTRPAKMMGKMTIAHGVAQIIAPAITGWLGHPARQLPTSACGWPPGSWWWARCCCWCCAWWIGATTRTAGKTASAGRPVRLGIPGHRPRPGKRVRQTFFRKHALSMKLPASSLQSTSWSPSPTRRMLFTLLPCLSTVDRPFHLQILDQHFTASPSRSDIAAGIANDAPVVVAGCRGFGGGPFKPQSAQTAWRRRGAVFRGVHLRAGGGGMTWRPETWCGARV